MTCPPRGRTGGGVTTGVVTSCGREDPAAGTAGCRLGRGQEASAGWDSSAGRTCGFMILRANMAADTITKSTTEAAAIQRQRAAGRVPCHGVFRPRVDDGGDCGVARGDRGPVRAAAIFAARTRTSTPVQVPSLDRRQETGPRAETTTRSLRRSHLDDRRTTRRGLQRKHLCLRQERLLRWKRVGVVQSLEWSSHLSYPARSRTTRSSSSVRSVLRS